MNWTVLSLVAALILSGAAAAEVRLGNEVLVQNGFEPWRGKRVGLLTNPSGVNRKQQPTLEILRKAKGIKLVALFAPEHGLRGDLPAGKEFKDSVYWRSGLPIYSLYGPGPTRQPTPAMLKGIEVLVYDLQDAGIRSYTYISTMGLAMEACAEQGVEFVVLDRPNPLGGLRVEGPILDPRFRSLVGQWRIPYVYGMTCGELARMINGEGWIRRPCHLTVVPMKGWRRCMVWRDTGLPWVPTSPNVPKGDTPLYLVATGILGELGGISMGSDSLLRFQCVSAPWLNSTRMSDWLNGRHLPGISFKPVTYRPPRGQLVQATRIVFSDPARAPLMALNYFIWEAVKESSGRDLLAEARKIKRDFAMFDKVNGTDAPRQAMEAGQPAAQIVQSWKMGEEAFRQQRQRYLIAAYADEPSPAPGPDAPGDPRGAKRDLTSRPGPPKASPARSAPAIKEHTVSAGETLYQIAKTNNVSVTALLEANPGLEAGRLQIGQKLKIPAPGNR